jgi:CheY-like chemotaxis protein
MKKKIVIVEDDYIIQELHKHYVENLGHEVIATFECGKDAIEFFQDNNADLILMDIRLEDSLDGIETMKKIQEIRSIPVVYISGNTEDNNFKRAVNTNMKGFLSKPLAPSQLEDIIDSLNDLTDSILYAERIQKAIFPQRHEIHRTFGNSLYLNRPRNIISGDFCYLVSKRKKNEVIGGVGDCTGHGIPAALLSVLCHEILTSNSKKISDLRLIINKLNSSIIRNLSRLDKENRMSDGLDLVLFKVIPDESRIEISGINRPFIYFEAKTQTHHYHKLKGLSIGNPFNSLDEIPQVSFTYSENDYFYFFTDGITDQFGGPNGKKLMKKGLLEFLDKISAMPTLKREIELEIFLRKWQHNLDQTDDILFIGISPSNINTKFINNNNN